MKIVQIGAATALLLSLPWAAPAQDKRKFEDGVKVEFPKDGYTFTLAEAAKGVKIEYTVVVEQDYPGIIALPHGPSFNDPAGPSGLYPRQQISGKDQFYCLMDFGLGAPPKESAKMIKKGSYQHSFEWDGRNWTGPSDFGNPKGKPFPAGTYEVTVIMRGKVAGDKETTPYEVIAKTKLVLK
jgi:hypothetical protein